MFVLTFEHQPYMRTVLERVPAGAQGQEEVVGELVAPQGQSFKLVQTQHRAVPFRQHSIYAFGKL